jgi:hypothetical protein
LLDSQRSTLNY